MSDTPPPSPGWSPEPPTGPPAPDGASTPPGAEPAPGPDWSPPPGHPPAFDLDAAPDGPPERPRASGRTWLAAGAAALLLGAVGGVVLSRTGGSDTPSAAAAADIGTGATPGASASPGASDTRMVRQGTSGTVTRVDGTTIELDATDPDGTTTPMTATTDEDTVVVETVAGSLADVAVGDRVVVQGTEVDDASVTATAIEDRGTIEGLDGPGGFMTGTPGGAPPDRATAPDGATPPEGAPPGGTTSDGSQQLPDGTLPDGAPTMSGRPGGRGTSGTVTAVSGATITVETDAGETVTVTTTDATTVSVVHEIEVADIETGDTVSVVGAVDDGTVAATVVRVGELALAGPVGGPPDGGSTSSGVQEVG